MMYRFRFPWWLARQPHFTRAVVVFQSDDWGSHCANDAGTLRSVVPFALEGAADPWLQDAKESSDDLLALRSVLASFRDAAGHAPVFTLNCIVHDPDYDSIENNGFRRYAWRPADLGAIRTAAGPFGGEEDVFELALHGGEHFAPAVWLSLLRAGDRMLRRWFEQRTLPPPAIVTGYRSLGAAYLSAGDPGDADPGCATRLGSAIDTFGAHFGGAARGFTAPNHAWDVNIESVLAARGFTHIQAANHQYMSLADFELQRSRGHRMGSLGAGGMVRQIRTVAFEPAARPGDAETAVRRACILLARGIPVVVNTHRLNYVGGCSARTAETSRARLAGFLRTMLECRPDLRFIRSAELAALLCGRHEGVAPMRSAAWVDLGRDMLRVTANRRAVEP